MADLGDAGPMDGPTDKRSMEAAADHDSFVKRRRIRWGTSDETLVLGQAGTSSMAADEDSSQFPSSYIGRIGVPLACKAWCRLELAPGHVRYLADCSL